MSRQLRRLSAVLSVALGAATLSVVGVSGGAAGAIAGASAAADNTPVAEPIGSVWSTDSAASTPVADPAFEDDSDDLDIPDFLK